VLSRGRLVVATDIGVFTAPLCEGVEPR